MNQSLVKNPNDIRIAMLGMVEGNGHPFSWSAIINGHYDQELIANCGFPNITEYLDSQPPANLGIEGAKITHIWCDHFDQAQCVARSSQIQNIVRRPEDVIGHVDAAIVATDIGSEHVDRVRPFLDNGVPVFIDKPLTDNRHGLKQFTAWHHEGKPFLSSSCMRYAREFFELRDRLSEVGEVRTITVMMAKSWERYGIHALEAVYSILPHGDYEWVINTGTNKSNVVHLHRHDKIDVILITNNDMYGAFGLVQVAGTRGSLEAKFADTFSAFKSQLSTFISYLRSGVAPIPFEQLRAQMAIIIAGLESRNRNCRRIYLRDIVS
ncbi:Gfo/Idh/MocA family oxidoreductase [Poriferisphaera sp. WC338]|uniref:Gfo/Idh/MocA family oxidoreductase n=1 Tax=Poriferisphaera sp. WC338 TaxID=3425129 RepID=UPI003D81AA74